MVRGLQWPVQPDQPDRGMGQEEGGVPAGPGGRQPRGHEVSTHHVLADPVEKEQQI